jgi:NADPH:quinone reductase-like Zn-dependent oxidoreductase
MKAVVYTQYGTPEVLEYKDIPQPTPQSHEVLVKVHAASINKYDWIHLTGKPFLARLMGVGLRKPKYQGLGADMAGEVVAVGDDVTDFKIGDAVFTAAGHGAYAEYVCVSAHRLAQKPANLSFAEAAAVPMAGLTALQGLRDVGGIQAGQRVLINGASGGVGSFAVQIAKVFGGEVTGVCSTPKVDMVRALGADHVIDYQRHDPTVSDVRYDLIFDTAAYRSIADYKRILKADGKYILVGGQVSRMVQIMIMSLTGAKNMTTMLAKIKQDDLNLLKDWLEAGKIIAPVDRCFPLDDVPAALRYFDSGQVRGKVVISME